MHRLAVAVRLQSRQVAWSFQAGLAEIEAGAEAEAEAGADFQLLVAGEGLQVLQVEGLQVLLAGFHLCLKLLQVQGFNLVNHLGSRLSNKRQWPRKFNVSNAKAMVITRVSVRASLLVWWQKVCKNKKTLKKCGCCVNNIQQCLLICPVETLLVKWVTSPLPPHPTSIRLASLIR